MSMDVETRMALASGDLAWFGRWREGFESSFDGSRFYTSRMPKRRRTSFEIVTWPLLVRVVVVSTSALRD